MTEVRHAGAFANDGERRVALEFRTRLPPNAILITNLFLPTAGDTLEIDLGAITPLGVFVVEVKDWYGEICFKQGCCIHRGVEQPDPRDSISMKAKKVYGLLRKESSIAGLDVATTPLLVIANDVVKLGGNLQKSVSVRRTVEAAQSVAAGAVPGHCQSPPLVASEIRALANLLFSRHNAVHQRRLANYRLGDQLQSPFEEYAAVEVNDPSHRVRLKRHSVDPLMSTPKREEQRAIATRSAVALRQLQDLHSSVIPLVYACFDDPDDDTSIWIAYEAVEGPPLVEASATSSEKLAALAAVAETLRACHEAGVLHRALTPECIILPKDRLTPVLLHFDFARVQGRPTIVRSGVDEKLRKLLYVAPEVRDDPSQVSSASDVFSLGVCSVEVLAGHRVENANALGVALRKVRRRELREFLARMIDHTPGRRPAMPQVAEKLRRASR